MGLLVNTMRTGEKTDETRIREQIEGLRQMTVGQLKNKYLEAFGETSRSNHKQFLFRRIAWRLQANAWGGLSERARHRALEIANEPISASGRRKKFLKTELDGSRTAETSIEPTRTHACRFQAQCWCGVTAARTLWSAVHRSLSSAVRASTGTPWNGFAFFGLGVKPGRKHGRSQ